MQASWSRVLLALAALGTARGSDCFTCSMQDASPCAHEALTSCNSHRTLTITEVMRPFLPDLEEIFTVWPPTGSAQCISALVSVSGEDRWFYSCTNLGGSSCSKLRGSVQAAGGRVEDCAVCHGDRCNVSTVSCVSVALLVLTSLTTHWLVK